MTHTKFFGIAAMIATPLFGGAGMAQDAAEGERGFRQCASCHGIVADDGTVIQRLGRIGPNLWGVPGRQAGTDAEFRNYSDGMVAAGEMGLEWNEEDFTVYLANQTEFLREYTGDSSVRSNMNHRLRGEAADIWAYLVSVSPEVEATPAGG
ncbi:c-type cytochrome [Roseicitreum antarcticum]|uniref:Cytochrome c n=1 Tax=Roseicitreum antarcticum TaxID=564137 RepID=A0A1H2QJJ1_9RHOB|nr:c-type cytochrome [Roseicitreum antarcticum]SDW07316.1 cytochrome c [Roseicitreum antarcticum]